MGIKCPKCQHENPDDTLYCGKCGISLKYPDNVSISMTRTMVSPAMEGSTVAGKYRIIEKLGEGGMGVVYKAEDTRLDRMVALKFLPSGLMKDPNAKERFVREAKAAAALSHPNICTIHEIDEEEGKSFIVMEYIEGHSVREKVKKNPLEIPEALDLVIQSAQGLEEAHKRGIIHRDIKSANIMVTGSGQAKVMDFGLAKVSGASLLTREASTMGTVAYMSPEQAQGQGVDQRTDIWSLAVVLYEMLTGQFPFPGDTDQSVMYAIARKTPVPVKKIVPKVKPDLERVVEKALEKKPSDRYQSMAELLEDLRAIAEGLRPIRAKSRLFRGRILGIKRGYFYAGIVLLATLIAMGILAVFPGRVEVLDSVAILPIVNESGDPSQDYFANSLTSLMISELYKVAALKVAPREAVMPYKNSTISLKEKARELNVKALIEASVLKSGGRVRLTASLIDPYRNRIMWSDTLEKDYSEILILQSELSQAIVGGIKVTLRPEERKLLSETRKVNPEAYDLCLQAISIWQAPREKFTDYKEFSSKALDLFRKAIDLDPNLALAYGWISEITGALIANNFISEDALPEAKEAALEALELDENLAQAHSAYSFIKLIMDWDFVTSDLEMKRALELEPGNHWLKYAYFENLRIFGRFDEALSGIKPLLEEPSIRRLYITIYGIFLLSAGKYNEAISAFEKDSTPVNVFSIAEAYALKADYEKALALYDEIRDAPGIKETLYFQARYACILAASGRREEALAKLNEIESHLVENNIGPFFDKACFYAALGEKDEAFGYLYQAYENHSVRMFSLISDPWLHNLHDDKRFHDLVKKVGFPEAQVPTK